MSDIFDLDKIVPEKKKIKIGDEILECNPISVQDLILLEKLGKQHDTLDGEELIEKINEILSSIIPGIEKHKLSVGQYFALIDFIKKMASPDNIDDNKQYSTQKKTESLKQ